MDSKVIYCMSCGAALNVEMNRSMVYCMYCGAKNIIQSQEMHATFQVGGTSVQAHTDLESLLGSAQYAFSIGQYDRANEMLMNLVMSGLNDWRIYLLKGRIDLMLDTNAQLFEDVRILRQMEPMQKNGEVTRAIAELMQCRGINGVSVLHNAAFHEDLELVKFCVERGADVNLVAGMNRVTPISIMFVPISASMCKLDGTPFVRSREKVKAIRRYLMQHGARDSFRFGF